MVKPQASLSSPANMYRKPHLSYIKHSIMINPKVERRRLSTVAVTGREMKEVHRHPKVRGKYPNPSKVCGAQEEKNPYGVKAF